MISLQPLDDRIIVEPIENDDTSEGGILIPETAKQKSQQGKVLATGNGKREAGYVLPMRLVVGDKVLYARFTGHETKLNGKTVLVMRESDILAIIHD